MKLARTGMRAPLQSFAPLELAWTGPAPHAPRLIQGGLRPALMVTRELGTLRAGFLVRGDVAAALEQEPDHLAALLQTVVFGYYTDRDVRERLHYPGQEARQLYSWKVPDFIEEGLTDQVLARGPIWRDPATGRRAEPR